MNLLDTTILLFEESGLSVPQLSEKTGIAKRTCYCVLNKDYDTGVSKVQTIYDFLSGYVEQQKKKEKRKKSAA